MWQHLSDPALWPNERLFFEMYGQALQARPHTVDFLDDIVESWLGPDRRHAPRAGRSSRTGLEPRPDSTSRSPVACCSICSPPATAPEPTPRSSSSSRSSRPGARSCRMHATRTRPRPPRRPPRTTEHGSCSCRGAFRGGSTNTAVLRTAQALAPEGVTAFLYEGVGELPQFNPDDDVIPLPAAVDDLRTQIRRASGVLFSTPEYAGGLPGSFKNLLDWTIGDDHAGIDLRKARRVDQRFGPLRRRRARLAAQSPRLRPRHHRRSGVRPHAGRLGAHRRRWSDQRPVGPRHDRELDHRARGVRGPTTMTGAPMLDLRPNCELCDTDLPPEATNARICSYECTFSAACVDDVLHDVCPNCGGGFAPRPLRPRHPWRPGTGLVNDPPDTRRRVLGYTRDEVAELSAALRDTAPADR